MKLVRANHLVLSKRNVLALLSKLEMPGSRRTICKVVDDPVTGHEIMFFVTIEEDDDHYGQAPGVMHPFTEKWIKDHD